MKDKIIIFIPSLNDGGAEKVAVNLSNSFSKKRGIILLTLKRNNKYRHDISKKVNIIFTKRRKDDLIKIIASNNKLKNFVKWRPKFDNLSKIVKSCIIWERKIR